MKEFYSHGKLLLTGEYVVLDGAKAIALPTKFGQFLTTKPINKPKLVWKSLDEKGAVWFEDEFSILNNEISLSVRNDNTVSKRLLDILNQAQRLNPKFLNSKNGFEVTSILEFARDWGLGSSSTLLNNIAQWANVDAFALSSATFGGSGYDIACAQNSTAILYELTETPKVTPIVFCPGFENQLFFVYLNEKKNSREAIKTYQDKKSNLQETLFKINAISEAVLTTKTLKEFEQLLDTHETLIAKITNQTPVKQRLFNDYKNSIKSLGGWGGDFVLATGNENYVLDYFNAKGYTTILKYKDMILKQH